MKTILKKKFELLDNHAENNIVIEDKLFQRCTFSACFLVASGDALRRPLIRRVSLEKCALRGCTLHGAICEDVVVTHALVTRIGFCWGCVFKHVKLSGRISGTVMFQHWNSSEAKNRAFKEANDRFYKDVDWALDISEGEFDEFRLDNVPSKLIRRDKETQVVVKRESALAIPWGAVDELPRRWKFDLKRLVCNDNLAEMVLVAPKGRKDCSELVKGLQLLRKMGVAEHD